MTRPHTHSLDQIKDMLLSQIHHVAYHYAPPVKGSYEDRGRYFTLNPGRADRSVGSFYIHLAGPKAGTWTDHATGQFGDVLDLIALSLNCSLKDALQEAKSQLGLATASPEDLRRREQAAAQAKLHRARAAKSEAEKAEKRRKNAHRLWLQASATIANTPVEFYLRDARGIDLRQLGHQPGAIRYLDRCFYRHIHKETGEVVEGHWPAMLAIVNDRAGAAVACHRTYLAQGSDGRWNKAPLPETKKVLGDYAGSWINLWKGRLPDGRKPKKLSQCPPQTRVYVAEGIEDALSAAILLPEDRHIAAISLSNLGGLQLPDNVTEVVLVADLDQNAEARSALQRAIAQHQKAGRTVRLWQNRAGGKDLNDALRAAGNTQGKGAA